MGIDVVGYSNVDNTSTNVTSFNVHQTSYFVYLNGYSGNLLSGDIELAFICYSGYATNSGVVTITPPANWTEVTLNGLPVRVAYGTGQYLHFCVYKRVYTGSTDPNAAATFTFSAAVNIGASTVVWRPTGGESFRLDKNPPSPNSYTSGPTTSQAWPAYTQPTSVGDKYSEILWAAGDSSSATVAVNYGPSGWTDSPGKANGTTFSSPNMRLQATTSPTLTSLSPTGVTQPSTASTSVKYFRFMWVEGGELTPTSTTTTTHSQLTEDQPGTIANRKFYFNGLYFGEGTRFGVTRIEGLSAPETRVQEDDRVQSHGAYVFATHVRARRIIIEGVLDQSVTGFESKIDALRRAFRPTSTTRTFKFQLPDAPERYAYCYATRFNFIVDPMYGQGFATWVAELIAEDPRMYEATQTSSTHASSVTVTNTGTFPTPPTIVLTGATSGDVVITNDAVAGDNASKFIKLTGLDMGATEEWTIDFANRTIKDVNGNSKYSYFDSTSEWWEIDPGVSTVISKTGTGTMTVKFRSAWL